MLFVNSWAHPLLAVYNGSDAIQDKRLKFKLTETLHKFQTGTYMKQIKIVL